MARESTIQKRQEKEASDSRIRKELKKKLESVKLVRKWGKMWPPMKLAKNKRLQWFLLRALEEFNRESIANKEVVKTGELSDFGWLSNDSEGLGPTIPWKTQGMSWAMKTWRNWRTQTRIHTFYVIMRSYNSASAFFCIEVL